MNAEIICVGTELLLGDIVNTNATYLAKSLADMGIYCYFQTVVGDNPQRLKTVLKQAWQRSDIVITTGGLGPTYDDLTKEEAANLLQKPLVLDQASLDHIVKVFQRSKRPMTDNNRKQALIFSGSEALMNHWGTAPGIYYEDSETHKTLIMLPGPPKEMKPMFDTYIRSRLTEKTDVVLVSHGIYLIGIGESQVESMLAEMMINNTNPTIAPYAKEEGLMIRVTASAKTTQQAETLITPVIDAIKTQFQEYVFSIDEPQLENVVVQKLIECGLQLAIAEEVTGGLLSARIHAVLGSNQILSTGIYCPHIAEKKQILRIDVNEVMTTKEPFKNLSITMAQQVALLATSDVGVAICQENQSSDNRDSMIWIAVYYQDKVMTKSVNLARGYYNDYQRIQNLACAHSLKLILDVISNS